MKVKRCPICLGELLNADDVCPQCGKVHYSSNYSANDGAFIYDRERRKYIETNVKIYATDFFFAYDKVSPDFLAAGGAAGFGIVGALVGGLADDTIKAVKKSSKKTSTAICYYWKDIASLAYPAEPIQTNVLGIQCSRKVGGRGIDMKLKDGTWITIGVPGFSKESAKDLYQVMNMLHQKSTSQVSANQGGNVISQTAYPAALAEMASGSGKPEFFKCAHCGVTQLREGDFCAYCGKPAPALEPPKQNASSNTGVVICPSCGNRQEAGSKFCFQCGQKLAAEPPRVRNCPHCGAKVMDGMLFCMECGTRLT